MQYITTTINNGKQFNFSNWYILKELLIGAKQGFNTLTEI